jgi:hypothetical protein
LNPALPRITLLVPQELPGMEEDQIDKAVLAYLKKKGYRAAELAFQDEQQKVKSAASTTTTKSSAIFDPPIDPLIANQIFFYSRSVCNFLD